MRALVVDDERSIRDLVRTALESDGFDVDEASGGRAALERIAGDGQPDVIVLDVMMPDLDGWEVLRRLKSDPDPEVASTPVVMLTARTGEMDKVRAGIEGAVRYLTKPFVVEELVTAVQSVLDVDESAERRHAQTRALTDLARLEKRDVRTSGGHAALSVRQREVVLAVVRHGRVSAAATALGVSRNSVYSGLRRAAWRLGLSDTDELLAMARDRIGPFR